MDKKALKEKIKALRENGISFINPNTLEEDSDIDGITEELYSIDIIRDSKEENIYNNLIYFLASEGMSNNLYYVDIECIYEIGDYRKIIEGIQEITKDGLGFVDIEDYVDINNKEAWVSFKIKSKAEEERVKYRKIKIDLKVDEDWVDVNLFDKLSDIFSKLQTEKTFFYLESRGQCIVVGCVKKYEYKRLSKLGQIY